MKTLFWALCMALSQATFCGNVADVIMSRCYKNQFVCKTSAVERKSSLPVGRLLTMAMGTGLCGSCNMCGQKSPKKSSSLPVLSNFPRIPKLCSSQKS
jgi:hypothetical protein